MAKKKKTKFTAATEARRRARLSVGTPRPERTIPDKRDKPTKHKKSTAELIAESDSNSH